MSSLQNKHELWLAQTSSCLHVICVFVKVQQREESDEVIARTVSMRLADAAGISYSEIATKAYESGRTELAIKVHKTT